MNTIFVISRYKEDLSWISNYTDSYIVYDKSGDQNNDFRFVSSPNIGGNQRDISRFAYDNYEHLPDIMIFLQAYPFDHCKQDVFDALVKKTAFTAIEYYGSIPANGWEQRTEDGEYMEINNNWYIEAHNFSHGKTCPYTSFDEFMNKYFSDYTHLDWLRFPPGSQFIVPRKNILHYPKVFWFSLMNEMNELNGTTAHVVERALWYILSNNYTLREEYEFRPI
jgi:hypothetical protein